MPESLAPARPGMRRLGIDPVVPRSEAQARAFARGCFALAKHVHRQVQLIVTVWRGLHPDTRAALAQLAAEAKRNASSVAGFERAVDTYRAAQEEDA